MLDSFTVTVLSNPPPRLLKPLPSNQSGLNVPIMNRIANNAVTICAKSNQSRFTIWLD